MSQLALHILHLSSFLEWNAVRKTPRSRCSTKYDTVSTRADLAAYTDAPEALYAKHSDELEHCSSQREDSISENQ